MDSTSKNPLKVIVVGQRKSGKTALIQRYVSGVFNPEYEESTGVDFSTKEVDGISIQFWDIAGDQLGSPLCAGYYEGVRGIISVYDLSDLKSSSEAVLKWSADVQRCLPNSKEVPHVNVFTKEDLCVSDGSWKPLPGTGMYAISAKTGYCMNEAIDSLVTRMMK